MEIQNRDESRTADGELLRLNTPEENEKAKLKTRKRLKICYKVFRELLLIVTCISVIAYTVLMMVNS